MYLSIHQSTLILDAYLFTYAKFDWLRDYVGCRNGGWGEGDRESHVDSAKRKARSVAQSHAPEIMTWGEIKSHPGALMLYYLNTY